MQTSLAFPIQSSNGVMLRLLLFVWPIWSPESPAEIELVGKSEFLVLMHHRFRCCSEIPVLKTYF
ncbi:MAG: hypothetical protein V7638_4890 [Acidobacteriota bacterium]|jgi:hypothetical protein